MKRGILVVCALAFVFLFALPAAYAAVELKLGHFGPEGHPATIAAARGAYPGRRLVLAFQPHRYTRTRDCFEDFLKVLGQADMVLLADV